MLFGKLYSPPKIQGMHNLFMAQYVTLPQYFVCKQADIELTFNKVSKNISPGGGGGEGFIIGFSCTRSTQDV